MDPPSTPLNMPLLLTIITIPHSLQDKGRVASHTFFNFSVANIKYLGQVFVFCFVLFFMFTHIA